MYHIHSVHKEHIIMTKSIVYSGGTWSPNIGNAFFNLGIMHALSVAVPAAQTHFLGDPPGWHWMLARHPMRKKIIFDDIKCDYLIISGPIFCSWLELIWGETLRSLKAKGTRIVFLSAGCMEYTEKEYESCRPLLEEISPYLLITRDAETYERYGHLAQHSHNGICFAFFANDYLSNDLPLQTNTINICFDKGHDYNVLNKYDKEIQHYLQHKEWKASSQKKLRRSFSASHIKQFESYRIVRPYHVANPRLRTQLKSLLFGYRVFFKPNSYVADIPYGYLQLYKNAPLTISERVHACVPAIAFGNSAWLISETKRSRLFSRIGLQKITSQPVSAQTDQLASEKEAMLRVLKDTL